MAPPKFDDLGKFARDIFAKHYNFGSVKFDTSSCAIGGFSHKASIFHIPATENINGNVEFKYFMPKYDTTFNQQINSDLGCISEVIIENRPIKGSKLAVETTIHSKKYLPTFRFEAGFKEDWINHTISINSKNPNASISAVFGPKSPGFIFGTLLAMNSQSAKMENCTIAIGYHSENFIMNSYVTDGVDFEADVWHKLGCCSNSTQLAVKLGWSRGEANTKYAIGAVRQLDLATSIQSYINNHAQLAFAIGRRLKTGLTLTFSVLLNLRQENNISTSNKVGLCISYDR